MGEITPMNPVAAAIVHGDVDLAWMARKFDRVMWPFLNEEGRREMLSVLTGDPEQKLTDVVAAVNRILGQ